MGVRDYSLFSGAKRKPKPFLLWRLKIVPSSKHISFTRSGQFAAIFQKLYAFDNLSGSFDNFNPAPKRGIPSFDNLRWVVTLTIVKFLGAQK